MFFVITSGGLGFNPFSAVKSAVRAGARIVTDPNVQRASVAAGQQLAPVQYAQVTAQANRAAGYYRMIRPPQPGMPAMMPPPQMMTPDDDGPPARSGVQKGNISKAALFIGAGLLVVFLLTKK
jgi:hypothetical protein